MLFPEFWRIRLRVIISNPFAHLLILSQIPAKFRFRREVRDGAGWMCIPARILVTSEMLADFEDGKERLRNNFRICSVWIAKISWSLGFDTLRYSTTDASLLDHRRLRLLNPNQIVGFGNPTRAEFIKLLILTSARASRIFRFPETKAAAHHVQSSKA